MITIYELLQVDENASKEEIENAYSRLVFEFRQDIKFDDATNKENEMILNRLKLAYEILTDDAKRNRYDEQLAQKRAESLIESVSVQQEEKDNIAEIQSEDVEDIPSNNQEINKEIEKEKYNGNIEKSDESDKLTKDEKNEIRKAAQKEFKQKLKKAKQAEAEYNEAYNKAYNDYLRKMGYEVEESWPLKRILKAILVVLVFILICFILWKIPTVKNMLINLYEENFIIKALVDIVKTIVDAISGK